MKIADAATARIHRLFNRKKIAYRNTFLGDDNAAHPEAQRVLADLRKFCGISKGGLVISPVSRMVDPYATAYRAGMRDVYLRIAGFLNYDEAKQFEVNYDD